MTYTLIFKQKQYLFVCTWSHLENYNLLLCSASSTPGFRSEGVQSIWGHTCSTKINEVCHFIISFCQGKVKGSSPAEAKFPAPSLPQRKQTHCTTQSEAPSSENCWCCRWRMEEGIDGWRRAAWKHQDAQQWHCQVPTCQLLMLGL